ncbi:hypothetical protein ACXM0N_04920 [Peribacillus simplex]
MMTVNGHYFGIEQQVKYKATGNDAILMLVIYQLLDETFRI